MEEDAHSTPTSTTSAAAPLSPNIATLTPRVDALREKLAHDRMASSARKERKKSLEGSGDARSTIEGMLTARRTARKASLEAGIDPSSSGAFLAGPPEWFTSFKQGMEARVSDLENQLDEKNDEVQQLRERVEALEAKSGGEASESNGARDSESPPMNSEAAAKPIPVPKLSLGGSASEEAKQGDKGQASETKKESKIASPKTRPSTATTKVVTHLTSTCRSSALSSLSCSCHVSLHDSLVHYSCRLLPKRMQKQEKITSRQSKRRNGRVAGNRNQSWTQPLQ
jgi:hypothetical protein